MDEYAKEKEVVAFRELLAKRRFAPQRDMDQLLIAALLRWMEVDTHGETNVPWPETHNP